jgi:hypothetical protein
VVRLTATRAGSREAPHRTAGCLELAKQPAADVSTRASEQDH